MALFLPLTAMAAGLLCAQPVTTGCVQPLCVNRTDDRIDNPEPGMLRYAVQVAPHGATIRFDASLNGRTIRLDPSSPGNQIRITRDVAIQGPGASELTLSGSHRTRLFLIDGGTLRMAGITLADGLARGGDGSPGIGNAGGGGGAAGLGGAILLSRGALFLDGVVLIGNQAIGGDGGNGGTASSIGVGGAGGAPLIGGGDRGGAGGGRDAAGIAGEAGPWGAGGGGGGVSSDSDGSIGGPGGAGGFGGGTGGAGGYLDSGGNPTLGGSGSGGSGLGGSVFVRSGLLQLIDTSFVENAATAGLGGRGAPSGMGKGGALFVCSPNVCGSGLDAVAIWSGKTLFVRNRAPDAGGEQSLPGRDDADVCGYLSSPVPARLSVLTPPTGAPGEPFPVTVTAFDADNSVVQTYTGVVHLTSTDQTAVLPPDVALSGGVAMFSITMNTAGTHTVTAIVTNAHSVAGTSRAVQIVKE